MISSQAFLRNFFLFLVGVGALISIAAFGVSCFCLFSCGTIARGVGGPDATISQAVGPTLTLCVTSYRPHDGSVLHNAGPCWQLDGAEWATTHELPLCAGSTPAEGRTLWWRARCWEVRP